MQILWWYLFVLNVFAFVIRGIDKQKAIKGKWRISEKKLLLVSLVGGWLGAYIGMSLFRHKTLKGSFLWKFWVIVGIWIVVLIGLLVRYG